MGRHFGQKLCRGFMATIPQELFESARLDGATEWQVYRHIVLPLSLPIMIAIGIIRQQAWMIGGSERSRRRSVPIAANTATPAITT